METNAAEDMDDPRKLLPRALYLSVLSVVLIYILVSVAVIGNLHVAEIVAEAQGIELEED